MIHGNRNKFRKERDDLFWRGIPGGGHQEESWVSISDCHAVSGSPTERGHAPMKSVHQWEHVGLPGETPHPDHLCLGAENSLVYQNRSCPTQGVPSLSSVCSGTNSPVTEVVWVYFLSWWEGSEPPGVSTSLPCCCKWLLVQRIQ